VVRVRTDGALDAEADRVGVETGCRRWNFTPCCARENVHSREVVGRDLQRSARSGHDSRLGVEREQTV
jgi:hypothetical protein